ncbi:hypothetical protein Tco_0582269, partial [Tanacetum coccineum]
FGAMEHGGEPVYALALSKSTSGLRVSVGHEMPLATARLNH